MVEALITQDEWVLDTPYIRRWRSQVEEAKGEAEEARGETEEIRSEAEKMRSQAEKMRSQMEELLNRTKQAEVAEQQAREEAEKLAEQAREEAEKVEEQARIQAEKLAEQTRIQAEREQRRWDDIRRQDILNQVAVRYDPPMQKGLRLQKYLSTVTNDQQFSKIFEAIVSTDDFEQFNRMVEVPAVEPQPTS